MSSTRNLNNRLFTLNSLYYRLNICHCKLLESSSMNVTDWTLQSHAYEYKTKPLPPCCAISSLFLF